MRPKHNVSIDGWYTAMCMTVLGSDVTFLVLHYPRPLRLKHIDSVAGWYSARFLFPSSGATFSGAPPFVLCVPLHLYFLPSALVTVGPQIKSYQRHLSLNHEVWVGL